MQCYREVLDHHEIAMDPATCLHSIAMSRQHNFPKHIPFFHGLSVALLALSTMLHIRSYLPGTSPLSKGWQFLLFAGIFATFLPAVRCASAMVGAHYHKDLWKDALAPLSKWHRRALVFILGYVIFNFVFTLFHLNRGLNAEIVDGQYVLQSKGHIVKEVDKSTFVLYRNREFRGLSGHAIFFQAISGALLLAALRTQQRRSVIP